MVPSRENLSICFAHPAYQMKTTFDALGTGIASFQVRSRDEFQRRIGEADIVVVSGLWHNALIPQAGRLRFIQSISAGTDQYDQSALAAHGIRLASGSGVNARAVSEHAMALILALSRRLPEAARNQARHHWRGMIGEIAGREDELGGKTLLIIGLGRIGGRLAQLAKAFDMTVIGLRRDPAGGRGQADSVHALAALPDLVGQADFIALTCPLTPETRGVISAEVLAAMKPSSHLVNVGRGLCVDEPALIAALTAGQIAGAALDCTAEEPLPETSPLWDMPQVLITPHTGGETRRYEANVIDILMDNLERLWRGESALRNQVV